MKYYQQSIFLYRNNITLLQLYCNQIITFSILHFHLYIFTETWLFLQKDSPSYEEGGKERNTNTTNNKTTKDCHWLPYFLCKLQCWVRWEKWGHTIPLYLLSSAFTCSTWDSQASGLYNNSSRHYSSGRSIIYLHRRRNFSLYICGKYIFNPTKLQNWKARGSLKNRVITTHYHSSWSKSTHQNSGLWTR